MLGQCYERSGDDQAALGAYTEAIELFPRQTERCARAAIPLLQKAGRWDESIALGRRYLEQRWVGAEQPNPVGIELMIATAYAAKGDAAAALGEIDQAISRYPESAERCAQGNTWLKLTNRLFASGSGAAILSCGQALLERRPEGEHAAFAKLVIGESMRRAQDKVAARQWYDRLITEHPESPFAAEARYWAGLCLSLNTPAEAIPYLQAVVAKDSNSWRVANALYHLGICHSQLQDYDNARVAYERLLGGQTEDYRYWHAEAHKSIGYNYFRQAQYDKAKAELELAISGWPNSGAAGEAQRLLEQIAQKQQAEAQQGGR